MRYDLDRHHRRSVRLRGYDYSQPGAYFVTVCTQDRACLFGAIVNGTVRLNDSGQIVHQEWLRTAKMRPNVELDAFVVMPNHVHGIIRIHPYDRRGTLQRAPTVQRAPTTQPAPTVEQFGKPTSRAGGPARRQRHGGPKGSDDAQTVHCRHEHGCSPQHTVRRSDDLFRGRDGGLQNCLC